MDSYPPALLDSGLGQAVVCHNQTWTPRSCACALLFAAFPPEGLLNQLDKPPGLTHVACEDLKIAMK